MSTEEQLAWETRNRPKAGIAALAAAALTLLGTVVTFAELRRRGRRASRAR